jgi:hypothetical protein
MGAFPLGLSEVFATKFSRMGRSLDFAIGVGPGPTTSNNETVARTTTQRCECWLSNGFESRQNRLVPDTPPLQVKVGLLYFTNGAIREFSPTEK